MRLNCTLSFFQLLRKMRRGGKEEGKEEGERERREGRKEREGEEVPDTVSEMYFGTAKPL